MERISEDQLRAWYCQQEAREQAQGWTARIRRMWEAVTVVLRSLATKR